MSPRARWRVMPPRAMFPVCRCRFSKLLAAKVLRTLGAAWRPMAADDTAASVNSAGKQSHCLHILSPRAWREGEDADIMAVNDCCWHQARVRCPRGLQHEGPSAGAPMSSR